MSQVNLHDFFSISFSDHHLTAEINCKKPYDNLQLTAEDLHKFLKEHKIVFGIDEAVIQEIINKPSTTTFPKVIARGQESQDGQDGKIIYEANFSSEVERTEDWNFRQVMRIPTVKRGEKIAMLIPPTPGQDGKNVLGKVLKARPGKRLRIRAGKNVEFRENELSYYAIEEGQVSVTRNAIAVHTVYEVHGTLSMKTGNIDFVGSVIIHGDVPTGYEVKAEGDIKIFGIVEGATIIAKGSVFVSEGLSGLKKGIIEAGESVHIGYINQGTVKAGESIYVHQSIIHSQCTARKELFCQNGNIIGGTISVGQRVDAKDIGNRLSTKTVISLGQDREVAVAEAELLKEKESLLKTLSQLEIIGKKLEAEKDKDPKMRIMLLRQRNSKQKVLEKIAKIDQDIKNMHAELGDEEEAELIVRNALYPNTMIEFGKYKHNVQDVRRYLRVKLVQNEITFLPL